MTSAATGSGSPLIAGAAMSGEFNEFSDDELGASNLFDFSNSPDALQSLETLSASDHKVFLSPQELHSAGPFVDSPNGSYQDSSSESASSTKRTTSTASTKTPVTAGDSTTEDGDVKMEWGNPNFSTFVDDSTFTFGRDVGDDSNMGGLYDFNDQDDSFMDRTFDFESASSSPEMANGTNGANGNITSPVMPTIDTTSPVKSEATPKRKKKTSQGHHKAPSNYSLSSAINGLRTSGSREVSPMSNIVASHDGSPAAFFNSPSPHVGYDFTKTVNGNFNGSTVWPNKLDVTAPTAPDGLPTPVQFGGQLGQTMTMPQQLSMFQTHPYNFTGRCELRILPTPLKSRVETQIPIKMTLTPLPPGVTKLHLPAHTISKPKLLTKPPPERSPDTLELFVTLVCTSAMNTSEAKKKALDRAASHSQGYLPPLPTEDEESSPQNGGEVRICQGCITRERKRAARKKIKKPEEEKIWSQDEERRVIVFNTQEVKEWQPLSGVMDSSGRPEPVVPNGAMQIDAPMRIACYCRHHGEKMGFNVIFTIKDFQDQVVAQAMSNPIMITDDHKTHPITQLAAQSSTTAEPPVTSTMPNNSSAVGATVPIDGGNLVNPSPNTLLAMSPSNSDLASMQRNSQIFSSSVSGKTTPTGATSRSLSRPPSPSQGGPMVKRRKASGSRVPNGLAMTRLDTTPSPGTQAPSTQISAATSPFSANTALFPGPEQLFNQGGHMPFATGPPTPNNDQGPLFGNNRSASMDNLAMAQMYSAPVSNHPSRAPSPNGLRNSVNTAPPNQFAQTLATGLYASSLPIGMNQPRLHPVIHKIIPNEGPKIGGIEVTVLGAAFFQGLEVWFGEQKATTTTFWGESSLVCLLPPSPVAGTVAVTFKQPSAPLGKQTPVFKYIDDNEDKLIRTALSVLGQKMSGQLLDVSDLARRILHDGNSTWSGGSSSGTTSGGPIFNHAAVSHEHLESQLLKCLDLIDLDDSKHRTRLDLKRSTGHTMLHLACSLGYHRFVAALLARGANPDARDKGGFTPLHLAATYKHSEIVRRLMLAGADPTIRSLSGLNAADVAQSRDVLRAIRRSERHVRSRSGGSLHSRTSSATSLRSLWEPMSKVHTHDEPLTIDSSEESPEYTSGDFEDEDPDEDSYLSMRRPSGFRQDRERPNFRRQEEEHDDEEGLASPTTALAAAWKDQVQQQIHQFQQSMALHFPNLPHLPQMPQMPAFPGVPVFPDYQAYLQQAPFMRRVQQLMPNIAGVRPDEQGGDQPKMDYRWWDISAYKNNGAAPPAYEDIFPQQEMDRKHASALQAATDAEADRKCSGLYDQTSTTAATASGTKPELPSILKIGRKNAITREQQEQFLRAREEKLKKLSSDRNLFFIWIPLLILVLCAMVHSYFPTFYPFVWAFARSLWQGGLDKTNQLMQQDQPNLVDRVIEV